MAAAVVDVRLSCSLGTHPKTVKLLRRLGPGAGWSLVMLIAWAGQNRMDGSLSGLSDEDIEIAAQWGGADGALIAALVEVRFLDGVALDYRLHDWSDHQPWVSNADARSEQARRAAMARHHPELRAQQPARPQQAAAKPEAAGRMPDALPNDADSMPDAADSMRAAENSNAPFLSFPFPSSPSQDQEQEQKPPLAPPGGQQSKPRRERRKRDGTETELADDWTVPDDWIAAAAVKRPGIEWRTEAERFCAHHRAKGTRFKRWNQAWWTWVQSPLPKTLDAKQQPDGTGRAPLTPFRKLPVAGHQPRAGPDAAAPAAPAAPHASRNPE